MADRREFTAAVKREMAERSGGVCECHRMSADIAHLFPKQCDRPASEFDHVYADVLETDKSEPLTAEDGAHLSSACHKIKSATDQKYRAKRNAHRVRKGRPKSGWWQSGRKLQGRGFDKTHTKKFNGTVVRRDA